MMRWLALAILIGCSHPAAKPESTQLGSATETSGSGTAMEGNAMDSGTATTEILSGDGTSASGNEAALPPVDAQVIKRNTTPTGTSFTATFNGEAKKLGITVEWSGMFVDSNAKPIAGSDFKLTQVNPRFVTAVLRGQELPSSNVRLYAPGATPK